MRTWPRFHHSWAWTPPEKASRCHHLLTFPQSGDMPQVALFLASEGRNQGSATNPEDIVWGPKAERWGFQQSPSPQPLGPVHQVGFPPSHPQGC